MMRLDEIGLKYETDKSSVYHDYLRLYERRLQHLEHQKFVLFEIGVYKGGSLRTWAEFFPMATIVGVDIEPQCKDYERDNVHVRIGDASDTLFLFDLVQEFGKPLVVIDDGSHRWDHQIKTFQTLFPLTLPGGVFIIEDIHTSFDGIASSEPFQAYSSISAFDYVSYLARAVTAGNALGREKAYDLFINDYAKWVGSLEFGRRTAIVSKNHFPSAGPT